MSGRPPSKCLPIAIIDAFANPNAQVMLGLGYKLSAYVPSDISFLNLSPLTADSQRAV